ncbi:uncharacterized protein [Zea mays]|uniref:uncharacterized protein isoform X2 n=1 Tax=Zea mays TaxID=4577 RepID=UPI0004DE8C0C|nr:uncharacterized protein LOC100278260 isoform X2 [Zea mays]|eukprot:XP_008672643.1 uncharacterized protein LOC100278260 isoform X2 [Zea mays]
MAAQREKSAAVAVAPAHGAAVSGSPSPSSSSGGPAVSASSSGDRWCAAIGNLGELGANVDALQKLLGRKAVFVDDDIFSKASLAADQARTIKVPSQILQHRTIERGGESVEQVKVLWSGTDASLSTWEDAAALCSRFPAAPAWGQASAQVRGNVRIQNQQGGMTTQEGGGERRSAWKKYLNSKVFGPQWAV